MNEEQKSTAGELAATLRRLERKGLIESYLGDDGQIRWRATEQGV
jgi:DNA-binding PadR family transcriptional regulator